MQITEVVATATISNRLGLHARPAAEFVKLASRFVSEIWVDKDGLEVNGKSIMGVMMLAAESGSVIRIRTVGSDAPAALAALVRLVQEGFGELGGDLYGTEGEEEDGTEETAG